MRKLITLPILILSIVASAQDSTGKVEPMQSSKQNYDLLLIAAAGLVILIGIYFLFRKTRKG